MKKQLQFKNFLQTLLLLAFFGMGQVGFGQVNYVKWDFNTALSTGNSYNTQANQDLARTTDLNNVTFTGTTLTGANYVTATTFLRTNGWAANFDATKYVEFSIQLNSNQRFNNTTLALNISAAVNNTGTASRNYQVRYGWGSSPTFANATNGLVTNLSTTQTSNITTIPAPGNTTTTLLTIRIHIYGASSGGNNRIDLISLSGANQPISTLTPPTLTADATNNTVDNDNDITFTDNATWRGAVTGVTVNGTAINSPTDYEISAGILKLKPSGGNPLLTSSGSKTVVVSATGYSTATVTQVINAGVPTVANSTTSIDSALSPATTRTVTCTARDQYNNPVSGYLFTYDRTVVNNDATTNEVYTIDGDTSGNDFLTTPTNASGVATFTIIIPAVVDQNDGVSVPVFLNDGITQVGTPFSFVQNKLNQTITFAPLAAAIYGDAPLTLSATASSGLTVTYTSSNTAVATVSGNTVTILSNGSTIITALQEGDATYNPAPSVPQTLTVNQKQLTVDNALGNDKVYDGTTNATFSGTLNGVVGVDTVILNAVGTFADANVGTAIAISTATATLTGAQASRYVLVLPTGLTGNITKANQTIVMPATLTKFVGNANFSPATSATSAINPITYVSSDTNVATIVSNQIQIVGIGTATITASQAGNTNYNAAADALLALTVQVNNDVFRSKGSGNWNAIGTWQSSADGVTGWADATVAPAENNSVYIQSGHTVTLTQNESCKDLNIANSTTSTLGTRGIIAHGNLNLSVYGKLRAYYAAVGTTPGTSSGNGFSAYPFTATTGKVIVKGDTRVLTINGEWGATINNPSSGLFTLDIELNSGQTVTLNTAIKVTTYNQLSGDVSIGNSAIGVDNGTVGQGNATVASGCVLTSAISAGNLFQRTGSSLAGNFTLNGNLILTGTSPRISMTTLNLNGTVEYANSSTQNFIVAANAGATPNTYNNIIVSNVGEKSFAAAITVNSTLTVNANAILNSGTNQILGAGSVVVNGTLKTSNVNGLVGATGTISAASLVLNSGSTVDYAGTNQTITTVPSYKNITLSGVGPFTIAPTSVFLFDGTADFLNKSVILKSDATGTAAIGQITGTLSGATNVTVERYIAGRRAFRFLTPGVTTTTSIFENWQNNGVATAGIGTHITGGATGGFDVTGTNNPSLHTYDAQATGTTTGFTAALNTNATVLKAGVGYRLLVRGDRFVDLTAASTENVNVPTTLSAKGTLTTGTVVFDAQATSPAPINNQATNTQTNGYTLIGNPYASPVDWHAVAKTGVKNNAYYTWDPTLGTTAQRGRYVVYSADNGQTNLFDDNSTLAQTNRQFLQSGQAVFIKNDDLAVPATLTFEESDKATTTSYVFRSATEGLTTTSNSKLFLSIYEPNVLALGGAPIDGALALFGSNYNNTLDTNDVDKLTASGENIAFVRENKNLAIETLAPVQLNDELYVKTIAFQANKNYTFKVNTQDFDTTVNAKMVDLYLNTETAIDLTQPSFVTFSTTTDAASYGANRFKIVFNSASLANESFNKTSVSVYPNPIVNNQFTIALPTSVTGLVTVSMSNMLGQEVFRTSANASTTMNIQPKQQLEEGIYVVSISNAGQVVQAKVVVKK